MKIIKNFLGLVVFSVIVVTNSFCMTAEQIAAHFIVQDSRMVTVPLANTFGTFLSEDPIVQHTRLGGGVKSIA